MYQNRAAEMSIKSQIRWECDVDAYSVSRMSICLAVFFLHLMFAFVPCQCASFFRPTVLSFWYGRFLNIEIPRSLIAPHRQVSLTPHEAYVRFFLPGAHPGFSPPYQSFFSEAWEALRMFRTRFSFYSRECARTGSDMVATVNYHSSVSLWYTVRHETLQDKSSQSLLSPD